MSIVGVATRAADGLQAAGPGIAREFVYRRTHTPIRESWGSMVGNDERFLAERVVDLVAQVLQGEISSDESLTASQDLGARTAALGLSASDLIVWIGAIEKLVIESLQAIRDLEFDELQLSMSATASWFERLRAYHLDVYESAHEEMAGWYTRLGTDLISYLTSGTPVDPNAVNQQARALGIDPAQRFRAVAVRMDAAGEPDDRMRARQRLSAVFREFQPAQSLLVREQGDQLVALIPAVPDDRTLVERLAPVAADDDFRDLIVVVVGEGVDGLAAAGRSCRQATSALEIAMHRNHRGRVTECTDVILEVLLSHNPWVSRKLVDSRLAGIAEADHLLKTLRTYIDCDMSLQRTAEELFIHPNTVAYRLRQIAKRTGRDMRRISDLSDLSIALAALDVIEVKQLRSGPRPDEPSV